MIPVTRRLKGPWAVLAVLTALVLVSSAQTPPLKPPSLMRAGYTYRLTVPASTAWSDTGLDVLEGQLISFRASGNISLQRGNPISMCGPRGFNLQTVQQPLRDRNIGALLGKIVQLISIDVDEETGEETRNERIEYFYIGPGSRVRMPLDGHLFLGVNENVVDDNAGEFRVVYFLDRPD